MKKLLTIAGLALATVLNVNGQGQVDFRNSNLGAAGLMYQSDGVTKLATGAFVAQLYYSTTGLNGTYTAITDPVAPFRAVGAGDGYWNPGASFIRNIPGTVGGQNVSLQVRVWSTGSGAVPGSADFNAASALPGAQWGISQNFAYVLGGDPGNGNPSTTPGAMTGFTGFNLTLNPVPEPSTIALGILGAGSLLFLRRKK